MTSSPLRPGASLKDELAYYKRQYEQLETDLADFQASSKELEEQLEKDIDVAEKRERKLKEQVEKLGFEVEEWKGKHKQAKTEANSAQNALQKEVTSIREQNRSLTLKLRDIEVANDDYERQARNTTTSLEDFESKLNISIERGVLLEDEVKNGEMEREGLRIENQRLRDELGDLKVESEITLEKLRLAGKTIETLRSRKPGNLAVQSLRATSPTSEASGVTPYSPTLSTPPAKSERSDMPTPPSPPLSDETKIEPKTPLIRPPPANDTATPRPRPYMSRHSRGPSLASTTSGQSVRPAVRSTPSMAALPRSESLYQMKSLRARMQKIEERVQSARAKLPATSRDTTPKASPRGAIPSSVTVRRTSKRESILQTDEPRVKRLSYGIPRPASRASIGGDRPPSRVSVNEADSRLTRPASRSSAYDSRPHSSMSGSMPSTPRTHRPSASISELRRRADGEESGNRRTTLDRGTALPMPGTFARRQSGAAGVGRRTSVPAIADTSMRPPPARPKVDVDDSELGETY